jgi:hypothetical protein
MRQELQAWFKEYAEERGGMSHLVTKFVLQLKAKEQRKEKQSEGPTTAKR